MAEDTAEGWGEVGTTPARVPVGAQLPEEGTKPVDRLSDAINEIVQRGKGRFSWSRKPRFYERYCKREALIRLDFQVEGLDVEMCALLYRSFRAAQEEVRNEVGEPRTRHRPQVIGDDDPAVGDVGSEQAAVLVPTVQLLHSPQRTTLPAEVWFGCVECVGDLLPNTLFQSAARGFISLRGTGNRKIYPAWVPTDPPNHGHVCDVIEGGTQVAHCVCGNNCKAFRKGRDMRRIIDALASAVVILDSDFVASARKEGCQSGLKVTDMIFGPCDPADDVGG